MDGNDYYPTNRFLPHEKHSSICFSNSCVPESGSPCRNDGEMPCLDYYALNPAYNELVAKINQWDHEYYVLDNPTVSDAEYDQDIQKIAGDGGRKSGVDHSRVTLSTRWRKTDR